MQPASFLEPQLPGATALLPGGLAAAAAEHDGLRLLGWHAAHGWGAPGRLDGFRVLELRGGWRVHSFAQSLLAALAPSPPPPLAPQASAPAVFFPWDWPAQGRCKRARDDPVQPTCSTGASNGSSGSLAPASAASVVGGHRCGASCPALDTAGGEGEVEEVTSASAKRQRRAGRQQWQQQRWERQQWAQLPQPHPQLLPHFSELEVALLQEMIGAPQPGCDVACPSASVSPRAPAE